MTFKVNTLKMYNRNVIEIVLIIQRHRSRLFSTYYPWTTVKGSTSNHPKSKTYWSLTEGGCLEESNHKVSLPSGPDTVQKIINFIASNFMQFHASYDMCSSMLSVKVLHNYTCSPSSIVHTEPREETTRRLLAVGGLLWQVPIIGLWLGKFWCFE